ncbi:MAG: hypothetical protein ACK4GN_04465 [Runella sp.]
MTLQQFFDQTSQQPQWLVGYFVALPLAAWWVGWVSNGHIHSGPWRYFYGVLVYLACVPGIFAITLNAYLFLFERRSVFDFNVYTQLLPILAMFITLWVIRQRTTFDQIPGFQKLSGLVMIIFAALSLMWFADRTRLFVFSYLRFEYVLGIFAVLILGMMWGWKKLFGN